MALLNDLMEGIDRLRYYVSVGQIPISELVSSQILNRIKRYPVDIKQWEDLVLFNYNNYAQSIPARYWLPTMRVCRGTIMTLRGEVVSFPYHKFFNLNESDETSFEAVRRWELLSITEKIDGVLIQAVRWNGREIWASRHHFFTPPAREAMRLYGGFPIPEGYTLLFEVVAPQFRQKTMIDYKTTALWYLGCRRLSDFALIQGVPIWGTLPPTVKTNTVYFTNNLDAFVGEIARRDGKQYEGVVIQGAEERGNLLVKVKGEEYVQRVRLIRSVTLKEILRLYEQSGLDEVIATIPSDVIDDPMIAKILSAIRDTEDSVWQEIAEIKQRGLKPQEIADEHKRWMAGQNPQKYIRKYVSRLVEVQLSADNQV